MIDDWAREYGVAPAAVAELKRRIGIEPCEIGVQTHELGIGTPPGSEGRQQALIRLEAANLRIRLFRNNSGAYVDESGRQVRYGLANESKQVNEVLKSPDLVGWRRRLITPEMVGSVIGQACMVEVKHEGWVYRGDKHEAAQLAFINLALADGCDAKFATGPGSL